MPDSREDDVRRLLAAARVDGPTPPAVVERLDRVLADLQAERESATARAAVAARAARRRHRVRVVVGSIAATVAVVALGRGVVWVHDHPPAGGGSNASSSSRPDAEGAEGAVSPAAALPHLRPGHLRADILARTTHEQRRSGDASAACVAPGAGQRVLPAVYGRRLAALVLDPPAAGHQQVTVRLCNGVHPGPVVRRLSLPAP